MLLLNPCVQKTIDEEIFTLPFLIAMLYRAIGPERLPAG